ncbi:hypothetical protein BU15DRAFT_76170 [Melanogaster broomeanus]|nr:hypothetical protein BU15DRAFT_76170 [Melanogaster broomeanus]
MYSLHELLKAEHACHQVSPSLVSADDRSAPHDGDKENLPLSRSTPPPSQSVSTPARHTPKLPSFSDSVEKVKEDISKIPKKCSFEDTLMDLQQVNLTAINAWAEADMIMQERQMLLKEYKAGIWDALEYKEKLGELMAKPAKCPRQASIDK